VKLEHGGSGIDKIGTIDLDFVTALGMQQPKWSRGHGRQEEDSRQHRCMGAPIIPRNSLLLFVGQVNKPAAD
jgi:hypothetical protein